MSKSMLLLTLHAPFICHPLKGRCSSPFCCLRRKTDITPVHNLLFTAVAMEVFLQHNLTDDYTLR